MGCIARVIKSSLVIDAGISQLITGQSGDWEVLYYDWTTFWRTTSRTEKHHSISHFPCHKWSPWQNVCAIAFHAQETAVVLMKGMPSHLISLSRLCLRDKT